MRFDESYGDVAKATIKVAFSTVPIVGSAIAELINYLDAKFIQKRLKALENAVYTQELIMEDFIARLNDIEKDEHKYYVVRNNLKYLCLAALPETVDTFNRALIECIMKDKYDLAEYATEILKQFNADDIIFLKSIKSFQLSTIKSTYKFKYNEVATTSNIGYYKDRNTLYGEMETIFWKDYVQFLNLNGNVSDMGQLMNQESLSPLDNKTEPTLLPAYIARSIIKMQSLGAIQCDFITTIGTASLNYIDRFHITYFGQKILEYVNITKLEVNTL